MPEKALNVTNMDQVRERVSDIEVFGDPGEWICICKASSKSQGWMKSTKVMNLPHGCVVQTTSQQGDNIDDELAYVPGTWHYNGGWQTKSQQAYNSTAFVTAAM